VWNGKYKDSKGHQVPLDGVCARIEDFKRMHLARVDFHHAGFVDISISRKIFAACEWSHMSQSTTFIWSDSQIGKSFSLEEYERRDKRRLTFYVRMPATMSVHIFMGEVAKSCKVAKSSHFEKLRDDVFGAIDESKLVIFDEIHECFLSRRIASGILVLELIREIHDRKKCGMVLCGTTGSGKSFATENTRKF
jgi:hypothetical protein